MNTYSSIIIRIGPRRCGAQCKT